MIESRERRTADSLGVMVLPSQDVDKRHKNLAGFNQFPKPAKSRL
jgi:hypothetical protein